jgi:hypothetical protein
MGNGAIEYDFALVYRIKVSAGRKGFNSMAKARIYEA